MAEPSTVARPYAEAAFRLADDAGALAKWSEMLAALALVAEDKRVAAAVADPKLSDAKRAGVFISILAGRLSGEAENFLRVLDLCFEVIPVRWRLVRESRLGPISAWVFLAEAVLAQVRRF